MAVRTPVAAIESTWSLISAMSGEMTSVVPGSTAPAAATCWICHEHGASPLLRECACRGADAGWIGRSGFEWDLRRSGRTTAGVDAELRGEACDEVHVCVACAAATAAFLRTHDEVSLKEKKSAAAGPAAAKLAIPSLVSD